MPVKDVIQGLWIGGTLSDMEKISISSFIKHGHEYHLYVYDQVNGLPGEVKLKKAEEIISSNNVFGDKDITFSYANFSDMFRYKLLFEKGGYWADTDIVCLRPFTFQSPYVFGAEKTAKDEEERKRYGLNWTNGCVIKTPPRSEIMDYCYNESLKKAPTTQMAWQLGPPILTEAVRKFGFDHYILPYYTFNPVHWWEWDNVITPKVSQQFMISSRLFLRRPHAVHMWNTQWNRAAADKNSQYSRSCLYEKFKELFLNGK